MLGFCRLGHNCVRHHPQCYLFDKLNTNVKPELKYEGIQRCLTLQTSYLNYVIQIMESIYFVDGPELLMELDNAVSPVLSSLHICVLIGII